MHAVQPSDPTPIAGAAFTRGATVFLESEGALVTSGWVAIGDHTIATRDITSVSVRKNVSMPALVVIGLLLALAYHPVGPVVIVLAILIAILKALHPSLQLVIVADGDKIVALEAASSDPVAEARLHQVHAALVRATAKQPELVVSGLTAGPHPG